MKTRFWSYCVVVAINWFSLVPSVVDIFRFSQDHFLSLTILCRFCLTLISEILLLSNVLYLAWFAWGRNRGLWQYLVMALPCGRLSNLKPLLQAATFNPLKLTFTFDFKHKWKILLNYSWRPAVTAIRHHFVWWCQCCGSSLVMAWSSGHYTAHEVSVSVCVCLVSAAVWSDRRWMTLVYYVCSLLSC